MKSSRAFQRNLISDLYRHICHSGDAHAPGPNPPSVAGAGSRLECSPSPTIGRSASLRYNQADASGLDCWKSSCLAGRVITSVRNLREWNYVWPSFRLRRRVGRPGAHDSHRHGDSWWCEEYVRWTLNAIDTGHDNSEM